MDVQIHISDELMAIKDDEAFAQAVESELKNVKRSILKARKERVQEA